MRSCWKTRPVRSTAAFLLALAALCAAASPGRAVVCTIDEVPAATLLVPYFEVDLEDPWGTTTLFTINNASATAVLAHVVLWSDLSVPVLDFNVYLTGYDVQSINMRDIVERGVLPKTASAGQDTGENEPNPAPTPGAISNQGAFSQDIDIDSCDGNLPLPDLPAFFLEHIQDSLTGQFSDILGGCAGRDLGDRIARGYITVDTVSGCTLRFPGDPGYFVAGGQGDATNQNVLWGDVFYVHEGDNFAQGETLVHVEADGTHPETSVPGEHTFYGRYTGWTAADNREPLVTNVATRFVNGGAFDGGTHLLVWRDAKVAQGAFKCGTLPSWYPLGQEAIVIFDEQENPEQPEVFPVSPQPPGEVIIPFPAEAQRTAVGGDDLAVTPDFGWLFLNLNTTVTPAGANPPEDPAAAQAWVVTTMSAEGRFSLGFDAVQLDSACAAAHGAPGD